MIKFTDAEPAKPKQAALKPDAEKVVNPSPAPGAEEAPKTAARKGKKSAPA
jgi:hypothetical protein